MFSSPTETYSRFGTGSPSNCSPKMNTALAEAIRTRLDFRNHEYVLASANTADDKVSFMSEFHLEQSSLTSHWETPV